MGNWDRTKFDLCGARTKTGQPCKMRSGQGTDHVGIGRCFRHGGASPSGRKAAAAAELQQRLHALSEPLTDEQAVVAALDDDLDTPAALDVLDRMADAGHGPSLRASAALLGIDLDDQPTPTA